MLIVPKPRQVKEIEINGEKPFAKWLKKLKDSQAKAAILARITRIATLGNFGNYKYLDHGIFELKIPVGPGYRIYFGIEKDTLVLIILGGDKSSQNRDIKKAQELWKMYLIEGGAYGSKKEK
jgi:putative addiction module killer protein